MSEVIETAGVETPAAAGQTEPQAEPQESQVESKTAGVETPAAAGQNKDVEKAFAARLAAATEKARREAIQAAQMEVSKKYDSSIAKLGMVNPYTNAPITTQAQLDEALEQKAMRDEAARNKVPVELYARLTQTERDAMLVKQQLSQYQRKDALAQEAEALSKDPEWGAFYKDNEQEIRDVAQKANCGLNVAKLIVYGSKSPEAIKNQAIKEFIDKKRTYKPVEGAGAAPAPVQNTPKTWDEAREQARAVLRTLRE